MSNLTEWSAKFFGHIKVSGMEAMGIRCLQAVLILLVAFWISRKLQKTIDTRLRDIAHNDEGAICTYKKVARFVVWTLGLLIALHVVGINLSHLFTTSGLFAVALAFAMKNVAENYIAGIMLRIEGTIKPGDVLEIDGIMIRVKKIGFRDTIVRAKDEKDILIPNSQLVQDQVANYTYSDSMCKIWTTIGVAYSSDLKKVRKVLEGAVDKLGGTSDRHPPQILLSSFGNSAVEYKISVWVENPWGSGQIKSNLNEAIWWGLEEAGIEIAFPQLDVHFDEPMRNHPAFGGCDTGTQETKAAK